ncbi:MAG: ribosome biogenesis GTPase YlqF [Faecalibacterium sp.]|nr:ribosome biogenesis GTPase YlqF [Faecalibacterium sp.]
MSDFNTTKNSNQYNIQWFPGHMAKTLRMMETEIHNVDASLVLLDARIPLSSLNPEIERITARKPKLYALNKADLADPEVTAQWIRYFRAADAGCVAINAKQKGGTAAVKAAIEKELTDLLARRQVRGMGGAKIRLMLCGIPNVGKSTFINTFVGSARAKAADKPGVTRGKQWVGTERYDLLDMPGVLWKKFDSKQTASNLAFIGSIKDDILDIEELAMNLLDQVRCNYPEKVAERYKLNAEQLQLPPFELLEAIGRKRGMLISGGEVNTERAAIMLVDEFRASKWGRISLEKPPVREELPEEDDFDGEE